MMESEARRVVIRGRSGLLTKVRSVVEEVFGDNSSGPSGRVVQLEARHGDDEVGSSVRLMVRDVDVKIPHNNDLIVVACIKRCN